MFLWGLWIDPLYIVLFIATLLISGAAQLYIRSQFGKWSGVRNSAGLAGVQVGERLVRDVDFGGSRGSATGISFKVVPGELSDHFDPRKRVIRLSEPVYASNSLAALGVAAHEAGHAVQHRMGYLPARLRSGIVPVASLGSSLALPVFFVGMILSSRAIELGGALQHLAILLFAGVALFQIVTLPVEFNASRRALAALATTGALTQEELPAARRVLTAAALTYVAALLQTLLVLLYLVMASRRR